MKNVHVGRLIEMRLKQLGMSKAEFARRINRSPTTVQDILKRESVDTGLLVQISNVVGYNFFKAFIEGNDVESDLTGGIN